MYCLKGEASVLEEFLINENKKKIPVAGCRCTSGTLKKAALFKVIRDPDTVIYRGTLHKHSFYNYERKQYTTVFIDM